MCTTSEILKISPIISFCILFLKIEIDHFNLILITDSNVYVLLAVMISINEPLKYGMITVVSYIDKPIIIAYNIETIYFVFLRSTSMVSNCLFTC